MAAFEGMTAVTVRDRNATASAAREADIIIFPVIIFTVSVVAARRVAATQIGRTSWSADSTSLMRAVTARPEPAVRVSQ